MNENKYDIPDGYYITIKSRMYPSMDRQSNFTQSDVDSENGSCSVYVFKSVEPRHPNDVGSLEHMLSVGSFIIKSTKKIGTDEFLKEIRKGIDGLINK